MKLTMDTTQIENLLKILDSFDFPQKLMAYQQSQDAMQTELHKIARLQADISTMEFLSENPRRHSLIEREAEEVTTASPDQLDSGPSLARARTITAMLNRQPERAIQHLEYRKLKSTLMKLNTALNVVMANFRFDNRGLCDPQALADEPEINVTLSEMFNKHEEERLQQLKKHEQVFNIINLTVGQGGQAPKPAERSHTRSVSKGAAKKVRRKTTAVVRTGGGKPGSNAGKGDRSPSLQEAEKKSRNTSVFNIGREVANSRMTFFAETCESLIKSHSKKKIFFQYDQVANQPISRHSLGIVERSLRDDPLACKLLKLKPGSGAQSVQGSADLLSSAGSLSEDLRSSYSVKTQTVGEDFPQDFEVLVASLNTELARLFLANQIERFTDRDPALTARSNRIRLTPVDCYKIEPYSCP